VAYQAAVSAVHPLATFGGLAADPAATPWDPELATAMWHLNIRVKEELTLDALLQGPQSLVNRIALLWSLYAMGRVAVGWTGATGTEPAPIQRHRQGQSRLDFI
jgi:hypothetical protein